MPILTSIDKTSIALAKQEIIASNETAMLNRAQYPMYEKDFLLNRCDWVKRDCPTDCHCHVFTALHDESDMCWVIKKDCKLEDFKQSFALLWIGANFQARFMNNESHQRINRGLDIFRKITPAFWQDIREIGNSNRRCIICTKPLVDEAIKLRRKFDTDRIYDSKLLSQIFYDSLIPHDTNSKIAMEAVGYNPSKNGLDMGKNIRVFLHHSQINITGLRELDNAPHNQCH
ncbi:MAG: hypothetical protein KBD83_09150 [Gammaproteobacteria bacterium]|nr:hypothetical protein [Gammaproteobacteria bacterium]